MSAASSDNECRHHSLGMPRLKAMQGAQEERGQQEKPGMGTSAFGKIDRIHRRCKRRSAISPLLLIRLRPTAKELHHISGFEQPMDGLPKTRLSYSGGALSKLAAAAACGRIKFPVQLFRQCERVAQFGSALPWGAKIQNFPFQSLPFPSKVFRDKLSDGKNGRHVFRCLLNPFWKDRCMQNHPLSMSPKFSR